MIPFSLPSKPLFSSFATLFTLILLYFPSLFFKLLFSPALFSSAILLYLLHLAAISKRSRNPVTVGRHPTETESHSHHTAVSCSEEYTSGPTRLQGRVDPDPSFMGWDVGAPLEVIHEVHCEGQEEEEEEAYDVVSRGLCTNGCGNQRYPSLSRYYPETDSDSDTDSGSSISVERVFPLIGDLEHLAERVGFCWEDDEESEDERDDGLIEIELDGYYGKTKIVEELFLHVEEGNLIEIDISPVAGEWRSLPGEW